MTFIINNTEYADTEKGYFYKTYTDEKGNEVTVRIGKKEWEEAMETSKAQKAQKKARKSKDIAYTTKGLATEITLTSKQVDFIKHIPDTCFYENGLDSTPWCDVLADEIGGQFAGKPMTVGAMISTLREKNLIYVGMDRVNGRKCKFFGFTEIGRAVASELGLN